MYYDLGTHTRPIATQSPAAQTWFDRGLNWLYGFNFEEAVVCFEKVIEHDPTCAMGYWGLAYGRGPFINKLWAYYAPAERAESIAACYAMAQKAHDLASAAPPVEQALIQALTARFPAPSITATTDTAQWDDAYANAMRAVHAAHPTDLDVAALFVEAMMMRTPWQLWDITTGEIATNADTAEMLAVIDAAQAHIDANALPPHPGLLHMHIHTVEMSATPEVALRAADALRNQTPDSGHLLHMPGHIYALCGYYYDAVAISRQAIAADKRYLAQAGPFTHYTSAVCHDLHLMMRSAMFLGQYTPALAAANSITDLLTDDVLRHAQGQLRRTLESYYAMPVHVYVRFGKWQEIIDLPLPPDPTLHVTTLPMLHYAKAIAHATLGNHAAAAAAQHTFTALVAALPAKYYFLNNYADDVFGVAAAMMHGEVQYHLGNYDAAFAHLRTAVRRNDALHYTEPWAWMHPPRHALGALLLAQGHVAEATAVYRADLGYIAGGVRALQHPNNVWSLHGYAECLARQGNTAELALIQPLLTLAQARTDVPITASCACRVMPETSSCCC